MFSVKSQGIWKCIHYQISVLYLSHFLKSRLKVTDFFFLNSRLPRDLFVSVNFDLYGFSLMAKNQRPCSLGTKQCLPGVEKSLTMGPVWYKLFSAVFQDINKSGGEKTNISPVTNRSFKSFTVVYYVVILCSTSPMSPY